MKKKWIATFSWTMSIDIEVEAGTEKEARAKAWGLGVDIGTEEGEYCGDSFELLNLEEVVEGS